VKALDQFSIPNQLKSHEGLSGNAVVATKDMPADVVVVACPFSLIITEKLAQTNLLTLFSMKNIVDWTERQWISTYICFHWLYNDSLER